MPTPTIAIRPFAHQSASDDEFRLLNTFENLIRLSWNASVHAKGWRVMNTALRDELQMEDVTFTPALLQGWDQNLLATNTERWVRYAREMATG